MYVTALEPISAAYLIHPSHQSVCTYVCPSYRCWQWLGKHVPAATNTHAAIEELLDAPFSMRSVSYQRRVYGHVCIPLSFLGNNSVHTFSRHQIIVGWVVFYAVRVVSKESRRLFHLKTSCFLSSKWTRKELILTQPFFSMTCRLGGTGWEPLLMNDPIVVTFPPSTRH
jgi:hypothetical protein